MNWQTFIRYFTAFVVVFSTTIGAAALATAEENEYVYGHCQMLTGTTSTIGYISSIYKIKRPENPTAEGVGIGNSFYAYVNARFGIDRFISPTCWTTYRSYQAAEDNRNKNIADYRYSGFGVRLVDWVYRGD